MPLSDRLNTKIRLTMLCLSGFELYSRWVPLLSVVEKASLVICNWQFSFSHRTSQVEPSPLLLDTFFKSSTLPWKNRQQTASWSFS